MSTATPSAENNVPDASPRAPRTVSGKAYELHPPLEVSVHSGWMTIASGYRAPLQLHYSNIEQVLALETLQGQASVMH